MADEPLPSSPPADTPAPIVEPPSPAVEPPPPIETPPAPAIPEPVIAPPIPLPDISARQAKGRVTQTRKTLERLEKILAFAKTRKQITNDDIQKLLRVSYATATRYLARLVKEGKLRREGKPKIGR